MQGLDRIQTGLVDTKRLNKAKLPKQAYEQPDGKPITIDTDYMGNKRANQPTPGPFELIQEGNIQFKIW